MSEFSLLIQPLGEENETLASAEFLTATLTGTKRDVIDFIEAGVDAIDATVTSVTKTY